mmetsp:Transcript_136603/g.237159  ORF Transcript_136603/g.237159 Transcript_136603/m.237159 type:complete len:127 (-) Transcript_136603:317-697(-)
MQPECPTLVCGHKTTKTTTKAPPLSVEATTPPPDPYTLYYSTRPPSAQQERPTFVGGHQDLLSVIGPRSLTYPFISSLSAQPECPIMGIKHILLLHTPTTPVHWQISRVHDHQTATNPTVGGVVLS